MGPDLQAVMPKPWPVEDVKNETVYPRPQDLSPAFQTSSRKPEGLNPKPPNLNNEPLTLRPMLQALSPEH